MPIPSVDEVSRYLTEQVSIEVLTLAYAAEKAAQARVCRVPDDDDEWPADLAEALKRRVARNLSVRKLPHGVQTQFTDFGALTTRVNSDPEVRRFEAPFRKLVFG